jgi:predicted nucleic-acid-binding Zn-ribbon protein
MATSKYFSESNCPRCGLKTLFRLGESHYLNLQLISAEDESPSDQQFYCKICKNCGYSETYSKFLIDRFQEIENRGGFGEVTSAPSGMVLLTIFADYEYQGESVHDFTVPFHPKDWLELKITLDRIPDADLVGRVLYGPYLQAWKERVGSFPDDFATNLRQLLKSSSIQG